MVDFLELLIMIFDKEARKKVKTRFQKYFSRKKAGRKTEQDLFTYKRGNELSLCTHCSIELKDPPVYDRGKPYCKTCYETHLLKIKNR